MQLINVVFDNFLQTARFEFQISMEVKIPARAFIQFLFNM